MRIRPSLILTIILTYSTLMNAQNSDTIPYAEIPTAPESYTVGNVLARSIDGLGYRLYWATESLDEKALNYKPGNENKSIAELIDHLWSLSNTILNVVSGKPNIRPETEPSGSFEEKRALTLKNLKAASDILRTLSDEEVSQLEVIFQRGEKSANFPLWNLINGQITDAIYHTGQIVSYRRSAGNPISSKVNVFIGKNRP